MPEPKNILWLSLAENVEDSPFSEFVQLAAKRGVLIRPICTPPPLRLEAFRELLAEADGYLITFHDATDVAELRNAIVSAVLSGKRMVVLGSFSELNRLLIEFDLAVTENRLCGPTDHFGDERTILLRLEDQASAASRSLFQGVSDLTVSCPRRVWYGQDAVPILVTPPLSRVLNAGDSFEDPGPRWLCCGGVWGSGMATGAGVLLECGASLADPYQGPTGKFFPGIRSNLRFAENILSWVLKELDTRTSTGNLVELMHAIEVGLYDFVSYTLERKFGRDNWWFEGVPESVRKKAAELHEEVKGRVPKHQALYWLAYQSIVESNWQVFAAHFDPGNKLGKKAALAWIYELNDIRNRLSHPLRLRQEPPSPEEEEEIRNRKHQIDSLCREIPRKAADPSHS